jgi:hypothetical protein
MNRFILYVCMDFLDPKKLRHHRHMVLVGYVLIAVAITFATIILLYHGLGYGVDRKGQVVQSGLVFVSSQPSGSDVSLNGKPYKSKTDTRMVLPSGNYQLKLSQNGYHDWQRNITVVGSDVQRFDYPMLFPKNLQTKAVTTAAPAPLFSSQSPDKRWLVLKPADTPAGFTVYDLKNAALAGAPVALPAASFTAANSHKWVALEWASDNRRLFLYHEYMVGASSGHEYIVLDRENPDESINVSRALQLPATETLSLFDKKFNRYNAFDAGAGTLRTLSLDESVEPNPLAGVVAFKAYGNETLLYVTNTPPDGKTVDGKVAVVLRQGEKTYTLRYLEAGAPAYLLDVARYDGNWYTVLAASNDKGVYVYRNPQTDSALPTAWRFLRLPNPSRVSFSLNAQYIAAQSGQRFAVYDAEYVRTHLYTAAQPMDQPQAAATWMDGNRLTYVSAGKQVVFDYDYENTRVLQPASPAFVPAFDPSYEFVLTLAPVTGQPEQAFLTNTALRVGE